jgi:flagellar assembly factor FliW
MKMVVENPLIENQPIQQEDIITFDKGIPGFEDEKEFVLTSIVDTPFFIMQSVKNDLHFYVMNPYEFFKEYQFDLSDAVVSHLGIKEREQVAVFNIVTVQDPFQKSTANMQAPVIINAANRKGMQVVLENVKFATRQPLF